MARAGFCAECGTNVWVADDGSCANGHPSSSVSNLYETPAPHPPAPVRKPLKTWVVVLLVLVALGVPLCGFLTTIGMPVFFAASARAEEKSCFANQRMIVGAAATFQAMNEDLELPGDFESLMATVIPDLLTSEPRCPSGGAYSFDPLDGELSVACTIHGSYESE